MSIDVVYEHSSYSNNKKTQTHTVSKIYFILKEYNFLWFSSYERTSDIKKNP